MAIQGVDMMANFIRSSELGFPFSEFVVVLVYISVLDFCPNSRWFLSYVLFAKGRQHLCYVSYSMYSAFFFHVLSAGSFFRLFG